MSEAIEQTATAETKVEPSPSAGFDGVEAIPTTEPAKPAGTEAKPDDDKIFDEAEYVKTNFGWDSPDAGKSELQRLRDLEKNPPKDSLTFSDDESKRIFDLIKGGKKKEVNAYLNEQERLSTVTSYDLSKAEQAAEIIKLGMRYKNKELAPDEVDFLFNKRFAIPEKPVQTDLQTDDEYKTVVDLWAKQVGLVEKEMIIEAKLAKPDLTKYQSELALPDISVVDPAAQEAAKKEFERWEGTRKNYLEKLNTDFKSFNGYAATFKDEDVELPIAYGVSDVERNELKEQLQDFDKDAFIDNLWFDKDGNPKIEQAMSDIYFLRNKEKIIQKLVNEAANKMREHLLKAKHNTKLDTTPSGTFQPQDKTNQEKQEAAIWDA